MSQVNTLNEHTRDDDDDDDDNDDDDDEVYMGTQEQDGGREVHDAKSFLMAPMLIK